MNQFLLSKLSAINKNYPRYQYQLIYYNYIPYAKTNIPITRNSFLT